MIQFARLHQPRGGLKYELVATYAYRTELATSNPIRTKFVSLEVNGDLVCHKGYQWDGPSGPSIDDHTNLRASLVHDAFYTLLRHGSFGEAGSKRWKEVRALSDRYLRVIMREDGAPWWRAWYYYAAVRLVGAKYATGKAS